MSDKHYLGEDINIRFDVFQDGKEDRPESAKVLIYEPQSKYMMEDTCKVKGNEVSYRLSSRAVKKVGKWVMVFRVRLKDLGVQEHVVKFEVNKLPVSQKRVKK